MDFKSKKYTYLDCIIIPFKAAPFYMFIISLNNIISALIPSIQILITAKFIDTAIAIFGGSMVRVI